MQKQIVFGFLVLLIGSASSADLGKKIGNINEALKNINSQTPACSNCYSGAAEAKSSSGVNMKSCVEAICSKKDFSIAGMLNKIYQETSKPNSTYDKEIQSLIRELSLKDAEDKNSRGKEYLNWIKNPVDIKEPGPIRIFNLFATLKEFSKFKIGTKNGKVVIDKEASRAAFDGVAESDFNRKVIISEKFLEVFSNKEIYETDPARVHLIYGDQFKAKVEEILSSFSERQKKLESDPDLGFLMKLQTVKDSISGEALRLQFSISDQVNPEAISSLNDAGSMLSLLEAVSRDKEFKKNLDSASVDMKKAIAELGVEKIFKDQVFFSDEVLSGKLPLISSKCRVAFEMAQQVLPTQKELDNFEAKVNGLKNKFQDQTKSLVCESAKSNYQSQISAWSPSLPLTKEQHLSSMKANLIHSLNKAKNWKKEQDEINNSKDRDAIFSFGLALAKPESGATTRASDSLCDNLMPNILPDATTFLSKNFVAGPITVRESEANGICYHELGHKLFHFMKYQNSCTDKSQFAKIRSCLLSLHTELTTEEMFEQEKNALAGNDSKYESEDWADLISAQVDDKSSNFACLFAQKLTEPDYEKLSLKNMDQADNHSSDLFRLLHLNFLKTGETPVQCEQALLEKNQKANFKNCLQVK